MGVKGGTRLTREIFKTVSNDILLAPAVQALDIVKGLGTCVQGEIKPSEYCLLARTTIVQLLLGVERYEWKQLTLAS